MKFFGTNKGLTPKSQLRTYRAHNSWAACLIMSSVAVDSSLSSPITLTAHPRGHPYSPGRPTAAAPTCRAATGRSRPGAARAQRWTPRANADASARPSKKPDVSSDRIGAASRRPRVAVNRSERGSTCALPRGAGARATRVAVARAYKCPAPHSEQVSSPPPLFLPLAAAASTSRAQAGSD